jgi:hypothetical protein
MQNSTFNTLAPYFFFFVQSKAIFCNYWHKIRKKIMKKNSLTKLILDNAQTITKMSEDIDRTFKAKDTNPKAWDNATRLFHDNYDRLAFPGGLEHGLSLLKNQDPTTIATAISYLEADPYFFRSGYIKENILRLLKKVTLSKKQIAELQEILIDAITNNNRREYQEYCKLARIIADEPFRHQIQDIIQQSDDATIRQRAQQMLNASQEKG